MEYNAVGMNVLVSKSSIEHMTKGGSLDSLVSHLATHPFIAELNKLRRSRGLEACKDASSSTWERCYFVIFNRLIQPVQ